MKKLLYFSFFVGMLNSSAAFGEQLSVEECFFINEDTGFVLPLDKARIHIEEKLSFFEDKIDELEQKAEEYRALKQSVGIGMLGAIAKMLTGDTRVGFLLMAAELAGLEYFHDGEKSYIVTEIIGSLLGYQLLPFLVNDCQKSFGFTSN